MSTEHRDVLDEVETVEQAEEALRAGAAWIMLDNMPPADISRLVDRRRQITGGTSVFLEASGNITLGTVRAVAEAGVDAISVGALTHSSTALDLTLLLQS
jgi:nicotinate-nucleotide pyrophosphorylase (carboxylating)